MNPLVRRIGTIFFASLGVVGGFDILWSLARLISPEVFGPLPLWLPEDIFWGLVWTWCRDLLQWGAALGLSSFILVVAFEWSPIDIPNRPEAATGQVTGLAILMAVLVAVQSLWALPLVSTNLNHLDFRQKQARALEDAYFVIKDKGSDYQDDMAIEERLNLLQRLGELRPHQSQQGRKERMDYDFELQILKARIDLDSFFRLHALKGNPESDQESTWTTQDYLDHAEQALAANDGEEFRANLWGLHAYRMLSHAADTGIAIDQGLLDRAKTVVKESWQRVYSKTLDQDERKKASYFFRKGKSLFDFQVQNYLEAYYGFQELHDENPEDAEVSNHLEIARQQVSHSVLFRQDMDILFQVPGPSNILFINKTQPLEIVRIGRMLGTRNAEYVKDFEFLRLAPDGTVALHWTAPYGRWTSEGIDFRTWDKDAPIPRFPEVLAQTAGNEFPMRNALEPALFHPHVRPSDLNTLQSENQSVQSLPSFDLLLHGRSIEALGYNPTMYQTEFLLRWLVPLAYFVGALWMFLLGWHTRTESKNRTWWLLVPTLPLVVEFFLQTIAWASRLVLGGLVATLGLGTSVISLGAAYLLVATLSVTLTYRSLWRRERTGG